MKSYANISSVYTRGAYKRPNRKAKDTTLQKALSKFGATEKETNELRKLSRGNTTTITIADNDDVTPFPKWCRAVAALNATRAYGEYYLIPKRREADPANKYTIKINPRKQKSFVKLGEITSFTITRLR